MKKSTIITIGCIVGVIALIGIPTCSSYNGMVSQQETVDAQWGKVENQYQRRLDLIPNLVNTVKGYAEHESSTLQNVTNARVGMPSDSALMQAYAQALEVNKSSTPTESGIRSLQNLERQMGLYINAVHEAYPDLKASQNFTQLQDELAGTENRIATERGRYTDAVRDYNVRIKRFPGNIVAGLFGFEPKPQFEANEGASVAPTVSF